MATINPVIVPAKVLKGGRHKVRISVAHNGETRYLVTNIILDSEKEFKNGVIIKRQDASYLNTKLRGILQDVQKNIDEIEYVNGLTCPELIFQIKNAKCNKYRTLQSVCDEVLENTRIKHETRCSYSIAWNTISKYLNKKLLLDNLTLSHILSLEKSLRKRGIKSSTINFYMTFLKIIVNYAKRCGYVQYRIDPFAGYKFPNNEIRQAWLTVEEIRKIRDLVCTKKNIQQCRDLFMLSYYLGGINVADIVKINFKENLSKLHYIRKKTETRTKNIGFVEFDIPEEAKEIIQRLADRNGYIKLPIDKKTLRVNYNFNYNLGRIAELTGIKKIIYYSARKSFSQHAFDLGISTTVIDYILGHSIKSGGTSLYSYIKVTPEMATNAIRKVLDNLK